MTKTLQHSSLMPLLQLSSKYCSLWLLESPISDVTFVAAAVVGVPTYCLDPWLKPGTGSKNETWLLCSSCFLVSRQRLPLIDG